MPTLPHIFRKTTTSNTLYAWFSAMHTRVDIILIAPLDKHDLLDIANDIKQRIHEIESFANCFNPASQLARYNDNELTKASLCSELRHILNVCDEWKEKTRGLFDVNVTGNINLSGFIKGYALDAIKPILQEKHITSALINIGNSSVMAVGAGIGNGDGWHLTDTDGNELILRDECMTTSGNSSTTRRHIINPATGKYIEGERAVSVVTKTGAEGEVMSIVEFIKTS